MMIPLTLFGQGITSRTISKDSINETTALALILAEHQKLSIENPLLKDKVKSLEELNQLYEESDSILRREIDLYKEKSDIDSNTIKKLKSSQKKLIIGSSVGGIVLLILGILL